MKDFKKDAVNVSQLNSTAVSTLSSAKSYTDARITDLSIDAHRAIAGAVALAFQHSTTRNVLMECMMESWLTDALFKGSIPAGNTP